MRLALVFAVDDDCERTGVTHAAYWDESAERYWVLCGTRWSEETMFAEDTGPVGCKRCLRAKLARHRVIRQEIGKGETW
ncbi:MAG: hypothetical protein Q7O66_13800 [Dehalococcoidia bacterium]|nr:hypothetical protein [Dehalococcoidia bacterium]